MKNGLLPNGHVFWLWYKICILGPLHKCDIIPLTLDLWPKLGKTTKKKSRVTSKHPFTQTYSTQMCEIARKKALMLQSAFSHFGWTRGLKVSQIFGTMFERSTLVQIEPFFNYWNFLEQYKNKMGLQSQNKNL